MLRSILATQTPHGLLQAYAIPSAQDELGGALLASLFEEERQLAAKFALRRRMTFAGGRFALREALAAVGRPVPGPILQDGRGAPALPPGVRGSISHKDDVACALAEPRTHGFIGVDVEVIGLPSTKIMHLILTEQEQAYVRDLADGPQTLELALRWSLKEALYKALDPYVHRYVGFQEVEVWPSEDGGCRFSLALEKEADRGASLAAEGRWLRSGNLVFATARVVGAAR